MKLVAGACYDKQHACTYLSATIFTLDEPIAGKLRLFNWGASVSPPRLWGPLLLSSIKFCYEILETLGYHRVKTRTLYLTRA